MDRINKIKKYTDSFDKLTNTKRKINKYVPSSHTYSHINSTERFVITQINNKKINIK